MERDKRIHLDSDHHGPHSGSVDQAHPWRKSLTSDLKNSSQNHHNAEHLEARPIWAHGSWEIDDHPSFWDTYVKEAAAYDRRMIDGWYKRLDNLLIYAGLFSAATASFISYTQGGLETDPAETTVDLLRLILIHRNDNKEFSEEELGLTPFVSTAFDRAVNSVLYTSLSCSLLVALGAVIGKDWLAHYDYSVTGVATAHFLSGPVRQRKLNGLELWQFALLIQLLPIILQLSLVLFFIATIQHLWRFSVEVAMVNLVLLVIGVLFYLWTIITTLLDHDSPYHSSVSRLLQLLLKVLVIHPTSSLQENSKHAYLWGLRLVVAGKAGVLGIWTTGRFHPRSSLRSLWVTLRDACHQGLSMIRSTRDGADPQQSTPSNHRWWSKRNANIPQAHQELLARVQRRRESAYNRDKTRADCWAWLTIQASDPMVIVQVRQATTLIPPGIALDIVTDQPTVLSRIIKAYNAHMAIRTGVDRRAAHPADAIFTGASLFHVLKAWRPEEDDISKEVRKIRVLQSNDMDNADIDNGGFWYTVSLVASCVEMVRDVPRNQLKKLLKLGPELKHLKRLSVPQSSFRFLPPTTDNQESSSFWISPARLWLDAIIYFAVHSIFDPEDECLQAADDAHHEMDEILLIIKSMLLEGKNVNEEFISHIAIAVAAIQLRAAVLTPTGDCPLRVGRDYKTGVKSILAEWGVTDKGKSVFSNITLAFQWGAHYHITSSDRTKDATVAIYNELLRLAPHYVPVGLRLSWKARDKWVRKWPEVMKMFPAILHFIHHVPLKSGQQKQILHLFTKILPEDWAGSGIHTALQDYPRDSYPQIHALSPSENIYSEELTKLLNSFLRHWDPQQSADHISLTSDSENEDEITISNTKESVVKILSWMGAYDTASELPIIVDLPNGLFQQNASIPSLLLSVIGTTQSPEVCNSAVSFLGKLLRLPPKPGSARFTIQLDAAIRIFGDPQMLVDRLESVYFRSFVFTTFMHCNKWLPLALKMRQPSLGSLWPAPSGVDWLKNGVDLLKTPDRDDIEAWCWRGLIWTWLLAKNHFSELGMLDHDGQTEGAKKEVEQAIEVGEIKWDWPAGSHPSGISNVEQYIKVEVQGEENGNNRPEKTLEQSKDEELKRAKGDGEKIKQLLFDEKSIGFVMDFILKMGMKRIMEHNHLMGRYWIPVAEDYLKTASKDPQCQQFHSISVVLELLSEYRPRPTA